MVYLHCIKLNDRRLNLSNKCFYAFPHTTRRRRIMSKTHLSKNERTLKQKKTLDANHTHKHTECHGVMCIDDDYRPNDLNLSNKCF